MSVPLHASAAWDRPNSSRLFRFRHHKKYVLFKHCTDRTKYAIIISYHIISYQSIVANNIFHLWQQYQTLATRNIWLHYEGRWPEFSQNGGSAAGFAEWLRAIDFPLHRRFWHAVSLTSRCICFLHIFIHHSTSPVLCYIFLKSLMTKNIT